MCAMKRTVAFATILLLGSLTAAAQTHSAPPPSSHFANRLLDDVVQMTRAGLSDATIIAYLKSRSSRFVGDVSASDLIQMQHAGVSEGVLHYIASVTGVAGPPPENSVNYDTQAYAGQPPPDSGSGDTVAVGPSDDSGYGYGYPYWYGYAPYYGYAYYPYWYAWAPYGGGGGWGGRGGWGWHGGHGHGWSGGWHGGARGGFHSQGARVGGGFRGGGGSRGGGSHGGHGGGGHR
jgi:hypothetical protein